MRGLLLSVTIIGLAAFPAVAAAQPTIPATHPVVASRQAVPGLTYGHTDELPPPKTVLFSAGPDHIIADAEEWTRHGIDAFFLDFVAREWSSDIWARDGKPWTIGESDETFQKARQANEVCRRIGSETFLKVSFDHEFEWFNDLMWQQAYHNFRQFAIFARETGCTGMALDIEYVGEQYDFEWEGYDYDGYTRADLVEKVRERMTKVMQILYDEFPDMVFLTFPEQGLCLGQVIHVAWIEEAARRNAPGGLHYCTEYTYRNPNIHYMFGHAWACNALFHRLLSDRAKAYWTEKCSIAAGVWPFGFNYQSVYEPGMSLEELRQAIAASVMMSPRYNWIYSHNCREQLIGRDLDKYDGDADLEAYLRVIREKAVVTTPKYVALAQELRRMHLRDYSADLDLVPVVSFAGPRDVPSVRLTPAAFCNPDELEATWAIALDYYHGREADLRSRFATQTHWMIVGPFENGEGFSGHHAVYGPEMGTVPSERSETGLPPFPDLGAQYDGLGGKVRWREHRQSGPHASVDFTKVYEPTEHVCAYAFCYVTSPKEQEVQIRLGTNDSGKLWVGGKPIFDYPYEGTAFLDREIIPITLPKGTTPILLKICNGELNWGFVFRITDAQGRPIRDLQFTVARP